MGHLEWIAQEMDLDAVRRAIDRYPDIAKDVLAHIEAKAKEHAWLRDLNQLLADKAGLCPTCGQRIERP